MKTYINFFTCILLFFNCSLYSQKIQLNIKIYDKVIGYIESVILEGALINKSNETRFIVAPKEASIQIRKIGDKDWLNIRSLDPIDDLERMADLSGGVITPGETLNFYLGSSPSKENIFQDSISFDWHYQTPGKYEIRIKYLASFEKAKFIYSNTEIFEV